MDGTYLDDRIQLQYSGALRTGTSSSTRAGLFGLL